MTRAVDPPRLGPEIDASPRRAARDRCSAVELRLEAARRRGCTVTDLDPETGFLHELRRDGRARVLMGALSPLNDAAASRLAGDKFHTATTLATIGLRVPEGVRCLRPGRFVDFEAHTGHAPALDLAARRGFPLVVKPNAGSRGRGVQRVEDAAALRAAIDEIWADDYLALVQVPAPGMDLRVDLLDGRCIFAYARRPLELAGDGRRTLEQLLQAADPRLTPAWCAAMLPHEPQWQRLVEREGVGLPWVPPAGHVVRFDGIILNLNRLCTFEIVEPLPGPWLEVGQRIGRRMALRHLGIDFKVPSLAADPSEAVIIEVNASPSLSNMALAGNYERVVGIEEQIVESILADAPAS